MSLEVLLVEGNPALQTAIADALLREGFRVRVVGTAAEALAKLNGGDLPLVITEIGLPDQSGLDLAKQIRARHPRAEIVFLSGSEDPRLAVAAIRAGASDYLVKHWDGLEELVDSMRSAEARHGSAQRRQEFLRDLADLNEGFLRQMVHVEKENLDLQEQLRGQVAELDWDAPYRVLLVDDETVVLTVIGSLLKEEGYEVQTATSAEQALERLEAERFQMMITDKNLPGQNGLELIRVVKQKYPRIETVLITGYGSLESAIEALHLGAGGYLLKPFEDINVVLAKVNELRARQLERGRAQRYLASFKERNQAFLERYQEIREKLQSYLAST